MADIYGCQEQILLENGLADSEDPADYEAKLASLKDVWDSLVPGFYEWFDKHRSEQFKTCLIYSARQELGLSGYFYTSGLELKHKLQKKRLRESEVPKEVAKVTETLEGWTKEFYADEERALRGLGQYRLAPGYERFLVDPVTWHKWVPSDRRSICRVLSNLHPNLTTLTTSQVLLVSRQLLQRKYEDATFQSRSYF